MTAGLGLLRLSPAAFWAMTPRELNRALASIFPASSGAPDRASFAGLMARFPDQNIGTKL